MCALLTLTGCQEIKPLFDNSSHCVESKMLFLITKLCRETFDAVVKFAKHLLERNKEEYESHAWIDIKESEGAFFHKFAC